MKKTFNENINSQNGFALVLTLVVMAAMTAIGLAALTNSTTDLLITRNEKESRLAFTLAEIGIDEALSRMALPVFKADNVTLNPRRVGESPSDRLERTRVAGPTTDPQIPTDFTSWTLAKASDSVIEIKGMREEDLGGSYSVDVDYTYESVEPYTWCSSVTALGVYDDGCIPADFIDIVLFCNAFGFVGGGALGDCTNAEPVYTIRSTGKTPAGTEAVVTVFVSASSLNVIPPGGSILFTERKLKLGNNNTYISGATGGSLGKVAARNIGDDNGGIKGYTLPERVKIGSNDPGCTIANGDHCEDISDTNIPDIMNWEAGDFEEYLGLKYTDLKGYADWTDKHTGSNSVGVPDEQLGTICDAVSTNEDDHEDCPHGESKMLYLDNEGGAGAYKITGATGRGVLIVTGDLNLAGSFVYEGFIYVLGDLTVSGTNTIWGAIMVKGLSSSTYSAKVTGNMTIDGSIPVASAVANSLGISKTLRWQRD